MSVVVWTQGSTVHTRPTSENGIQLPKWQGNWKRSHMWFIPRKMGVLPPKEGNIEGYLAVGEALLSSPSFVVWSTKVMFVLNGVELGGNKPDKQLHVLCFYLAEVESPWYMRITSGRYSFAVACYLSVLFFFHHLLHCMKFCLLIWILFHLWDYCSGKVSSSSSIP